MALTYADLIEVDLGRLGSAVTDWGSTVKGLKTLAENARTGMLAKSDAARWAGVNATVTRGFVAETAKEIADLHAEADSIHHVLDDAHTELVSLQKQIRAAQAEAQKWGISVQDYGDGTVHCVYPHIRGDTDVRTTEENTARDELAGRINRILAHAAEIDVSVARALNKSHGNDAHNAGHSSYESLDDAQAERAAELAKLGPEMSDKQYLELNSIMKFNARDSDFSTDFYKSLGGPMDALEFYGRMSLDGTIGDDKDRLALVRQLQKNMGLALASATDPDNRSHLPASWTSEFRKLGTQQIPLYPAGSAPYGYQLLGGMLRYGNYDARFINPIAEHIVQLHRKDPYRFMGNKPMAAGSDLDWGFNPSGRNGAGYDPLTSVLEGLGHSPEAAKRFFTDAPTVYREDGTVDRNATLEADFYFAELNRTDFEWAPDSLAHAGGEGAKHAREMGPDALGHALEAATTGAAWDADPPVLRRDEKTWEIMEKVVLRYNVASEGGPPPEIMKDSLARMGAAYIDDLNYSLMDWGNTGDELGRGRIFGDSSDGWERRAFETADARNFMMLVAGDEEGYKTMSAAQQVYTASGLASHEDNRDDGLAFAHNSAKANGILDESRAHQIREDFKNDETAKNLEMGKQGEWRKTLMTGVVTAVAAGGTALVLGPAAGIVATTAVPVLLGTGASVVSTAYGNHTTQYLEDSAYKNDAEALRTVQGLEAVGEHGAWLPVYNYANQIGMTQVEILDLNRQIEGSYGDGKDAISNAEKVSQ
ncbi:hypothetical protein BM536_030305 [Streptomyces phaeoluteigriseus]|uniref:AG2 protein n=1 Tax=Streptomyces phaeoluteigriseus TaxID=114686 RepID=A0A1V6MJJ4_9ACTN|nr:hypothetical protein [Streptomyces phaeoluteigriseus]OQD52483.1 hypothetical protein BM536_030305 [Streptomyces phaeoluteigriseus]